MTLTKERVAHMMGKTLTQDGIRNGGRKGTLVVLSVWVWMNPSLDCVKGRATLVFLKEKK